MLARASDLAPEEARKRVALPPPWIQLGAN
jgi:hypothetical protein